MEAHLPDSFELCAVQLAGREGRFSEQPYRCMSALLERELEGLLDVPFALMGYSAGAVMAHALALRLAERGKHIPDHLFVGACPATAFLRYATLHSRMTDGELEAALARLNGQAKAESGERELLALMMPVIRADLELIESFDSPGAMRLSCPVSAFGGTHDAQVPIKWLNGWSTTTDDRFTSHLFPGDHFFYS